MMEPAAGFNPIVVGFQFGIYFVWLMFLSWLVSRLIIRDGDPPMRAALCVVISVMIAWGLAFALEAAKLRLMSGYSFQWRDLIAQLGAPLAVFLWEWRSFQRHWIDDEDIGEIFE